MPKRRGNRFQLYTDKAGEVRWRLRAGNHRIIATSGEGYREERDARAAIALVDGDQGTPIEDLTE